MTRILKRWSLVPGVLVLPFVLTACADSRTGWVRNESDTVMRVRFNMKLPLASISTVRTLSLSTLVSAVPPLGRFSAKPCSRRGVVITKMINNTNARSNSGVMLISLNVTSELRCEKRRMIQLT